MSLAEAEYVLPLRWQDDRGLAELAGYLERLVRWLPVTVVDGSDPDRFAAHARAFPPAVRHVRPDPWPGGNGKVAGVVTGLALATAERVVVADDDVRYDAETLRAVLDRLDHADVVRPQNVFDPLPWHARWDTARTLLNRAFGADYPGTLALRRTALGPDGYDGDVLFENLELLRTVRARGPCGAAPGSRTARRRRSRPGPGPCAAARACPGSRRRTPG
ncbi:glycosyltransferase [Cellulomonas endometrii]|uniref:glycosyltransferase n=1 Tax=Cellulomonas endometrii TaxID=3036301 RepID=UPI0024AD7B5C|nr:glycosyltransferase [Cellulomonas endometrii]